MGAPKRKNASFKARIEDFEAEDVREFYDNMMMRVWYLEGKERIFRIVRVQRITKQEGEEVERRAVLRLEDRNGPVPLPFELNPTNRDTVIRLYGPKKKNWLGKLIQLFPTTCEAFGETKECIRIRPYDPATRQRVKPASNMGMGLGKGRPTADGPAPRMAPEPESQSSGLDLDDDRDDDTGSVDLDEGPEFTRNSYVDSTSDNTEPPAGALETDIIR